MNCDKCDVSLERIPENFPWNLEHWICPACDSTYNLEEKMDKDLQEEAEDFFEMMQEAILIGKENSERIRQCERCLAMILKEVREIQHWMKT